MIPDRFLASIEQNENAFFLCTFPSTNREIDSKSFNRIKKFFLKFIHDSLRKDAGLSISMAHTFVSITWEAVKNASDHGNNCDPNKLITLQAWVGIKGFAASIKDDGDFFKQQHIKTCFEEKIKPDYVWEKKNNLNYNLGIGTIFCATELFVDTETGTLYILYKI